MKNLSSNTPAVSIRSRRPTLLIGFATLWSLPGLAPALELGEGFDLAALTTHGIDPKVSDYFRSAARFREGVQVVGLRVNGNPLGSVDARFDAQGQLCFTPGLLEKAGLVIGGVSAGRERLVETIELPNHPWFFACQFHPEFTSTPRKGHPLFTAFVKAALAKNKG